MSNVRRQRGARLRRAVLVGILVTAGSVLVTSSPAAACSFPPPELTVTPTQGSAGDTITITGTNWFDVSGDIAPNCDGAVITMPPSVDLTWEQGGEVVVLATDVPVDNYAFSTAVDLPAGATPGAATVAATRPGPEHPCTCVIGFTVLEPPPPPTVAPETPPGTVVRGAPRFTG
jgi:hypothetical protein